PTVTHRRSEGMVERAALVRLPGAEIDDRVAEVRERLPAEEAQGEPRLRAEAGGEDRAAIRRLGLRPGPDDDAQRSFDDAVRGLGRHVAPLVRAADLRFRARSVLGTTAARQVEPRSGQVG